MSYLRNIITALFSFLFISAFTQDFSKIDLPLQSENTLQLIVGVAACFCSELVKTIIKY